MFAMFLKMRLDVLLNDMFFNTVCWGESVVLSPLSLVSVRFLHCFVHFPPSKADEGRAGEGGTTDSIVNPLSVKSPGMMLRSHCARYHSAIQ